MKQITILTASVLLLLVSCGDKKPAQKPNDSGKAAALSVDVKIVARDTVAESIEVAGNILPFELTEIRPEISGRIISLNFKEGSTVQKNTLLVKLFDGDLQAQLKKLQVQQQIADKTEERQRELLKINGISQQDYDLSLLQLNNIKADIELLKVNIAKTEIKAPYTGRIGLRNISLGAFVSPSNIITSISQVDQKKISFSIPERYSNQVKPGMKINFGIEGKDEDYTASVLASESVIESQTRNLKIVATINDGKNELVPGTFAKVSLTLGENTNAVSVPSQCVVPSARSKQVVLFKNGEPVFVNVKTGIRGADNVQITEGVQPGDTVIVTGLLFIRKDSKLKLGKIQ
ncbi:MAG: efflux RND transporter periplasmic adaptor subunit [Bacteroidetes bacterium]|nr:efflux RND transporter periplasmic adaptor subunit [Bacteroidota bacterium]